MAGCASPESESTPTIAIANLQQHPILDAVEEGVIDELAARGYVADSSANFIMRNASGDMQRVSAIASEIASRDLNITVAISTPVAQAVTRQVDGLVVFGALTDPVGAGIVASLDSTREQITGTTDALPYEEQLKLIRRMSPESERLGILFNPGEASSQYAIQEIRRVAPGLDFKIVEGPVNSTNEVATVARNIVGRSDVLLISTDNTVAAGIAGAVRVAAQQSTPLYAFDSGSVSKGAIAAVSPGYYDIGRQTGALAVRMLEGERNLPIQQPRSGDIYLNLEAARQMGYDVPDDIRKEAVQVYDKIDADN